MDRWLKSNNDDLNENGDNEKMRFKETPTEKLIKLINEQTKPKKEQKKQK